MRFKNFETLKYCHETYLQSNAMPYVCVCVYLYWSFNYMHIYMCKYI